MEDFADIYDEEWCRNYPFNKEEIQKSRIHFLRIVILDKRQTVNGSSRKRNVRRYVVLEFLTCYPMISVGMI